MIWSWLGGWKWIGTALHRNMLLSVCARARVTLTNPMLKYGCVCLCVCCFLHWGVWVCAIWQLRRMKRMRRLGRGPRYDDSSAPCVLPLCGPNKHVCLSYSTPNTPIQKRKHTDVSVNTSTSTVYSCPSDSQGLKAEQYSKTFWGFGFQFIPFPKCFNSATDSFIYPMWWDVPKL